MWRGVRGWLVVAGFLSCSVLPTAADVTGWLAYPDAAPAPRWRYAHGASLLGPQCLVVTHGYNNRDPATLQPDSDYRDDTWALSAGASHGEGVSAGAVAWQRSATSGMSAGGATSIPLARYGHAFMRLGSWLVLYGGDDGGHVTSSTGGYVWGSFRDDVWLLHGSGVDGMCAQPVGHDGDGWWQEVGDQSAFTTRGLDDRSGGDAATPAARSLHGCVAVPLPLVDGAGWLEVGLCVGGLIRVPELTDLSSGASTGKSQTVSPFGVQDSDESWWMVLQRANDAPRATPRVRWSRADSAIAGDGPAARDGHAMAYYPRAVAGPDGAGGAAAGTGAMEHSVFVYGGTGSSCDPAALRAAGLVEGVDFTVYSRNVSLPSKNPAFRGTHPTDLHSASGSAAGNGGPDEPEFLWSNSPMHTCQFADTWRLTWTDRGIAPAADGDVRVSYHGELPPAADAASAVRWPVGLRWQRLSFHSTPPATSRANGMLSSFSAWLATRGVKLPGWLGGRRADDTQPSPRSMPAMTVLHDGLLLFGGAVCLPGCTCHGDTWRLYVASLADPAAPVTATVDGRSVGMAWVPHAPAPTAVPLAVDLAAHVTLLPAGPWNPHAPVHADLASLQRAESDDPAAWLTLPARASGALSTAVGPVDVSLGGEGAPFPRGRYRHTLTSEYRYLHTHIVLHSARQDARALAYGPTLPAIAILFGGESYQPSTYFRDTWLFASLRLGEGEGRRSNVRAHREAPRRQQALPTH